MQPVQTPEGVEIATGDAPTLALVWLHGLGADGFDFLPIVPELALPCATRFVFPHAPVRPVTINGGAPMRAWYDIYSFGPGGLEDEAGVRASAAKLEALVAREAERGIARERIVVAGFSQGGAIALHAGLRSVEPLGGILALSTYLPLSGRLAAERSAASAALPIFMAHGRQDPVVGLALADRSRDVLARLGYAFDWHTYEMGHSVCAAEITDIGTWLARFA